MLNMSAVEDYSESSGSPSSHRGSPYSSPSQQVPHLTNVFSGISCGDDDIPMMINDGKQPFLRIIQQPQNHFRFRYKSEMVGTHGCLLGRATSAKNKTHPTVELVNYSGRAVIRVRLAQVDKDEEHPHKLLEDDHDDEQDEREVSTYVPEQGSYKVGFAGMGIIHTAKKNVPSLLFKKYMERLKDANPKELRTRCENIAKTINLNIVRLRFSAHDVVTDKEICPPVFSEPIHNMKSAATNDLKICRISRYFGRPQGGDDVFILVEKVNKKNISIRFFELNEQGEEVWSANGYFLQSDVHHQYAIVFRTPPYKDSQISKDVKVFIELVRPTDGRCSEPKEFVYRAEQMYKGNKRRRVNSSFSSLGSASGGSIKSIGEIPTTVEMLDTKNEGITNIPHFQIKVPSPPMVQPISTNDLVADALFFNTSSDNSNGSEIMFAQPQIPDPPVIQFTSNEFDRLISSNIPTEERQQFMESDWNEYLASFEDKSHSISDYIKSSVQLVADGAPKVEIKTEPMSPVKDKYSSAEKKPNIVGKAKSSGEYNAVYKTEDGVEVKKLVKEVCEIIKTKGGYKKQTVRNKLERLFELRLSNGDTFLHMTLSNNQPSFEYIIKLIHSLQMIHLLNLTNDHQQTILHLAVIHDLPRLVDFLVGKGCDPMVTDTEGNNVIHYAVICNTCLKPLLKAIKTYKVPCDLDAYNHEKQTALHLAAIYKSESSARLLLEHGASYNARDSEGRTALHLATYDDDIGVTAALLEFVPASNIDAIDDRGNTALQIVCGCGIRPNTLKIVKLLLEKNADPLKHEKHNEPACKLARDKPAIWDLLKKYAPHTALAEDEIKSEPEDEFESADETEITDSGLHDLSLYVMEVSAILDASGGWRRLAQRTRVESLLSWFANTRSPTTTLLLHLKELGDNINSKSLALYLQDLGEVDAANIIRRCID